MAAMGLAGFMFLITFYFWYSNGFSLAEYIFGLEMGIFTIGLTWMKCNGETTLVKKAEALATGAFGVR